MQKFSIKFNKMSLCVFWLTVEIVMCIHVSIIFCTIIFVADIFLILECVICYNKMYYMFTCKHSMEILMLL